MSELKPNQTARQPLVSGSIASELEPRLFLGPIRPLPDLRTGDTFLIADGSSITYYGETWEMAPQVPGEGYR
jgi:hypothetical protein